MSLTVATLIPGFFLILLGALFLSGNSAVFAMFKAFPRSKTAAGLLFGAGALWFLYIIGHLSEADFGEYRVQLLIGFALVAALSFFYVPDFLAVRGACILMLLIGIPLLYGQGFMVYDPIQICLYKIAVYIGVIIAIYLGAVPFRLRDFFQWLFTRPNRPKILGSVSMIYGLILVAVAFTY